eukprot:scaffold3849_cov179-Amphora_coffeaeformis.AAC.35
MMPVTKSRARGPLEQMGFFDVPDSIHVAVQRSGFINKREGDKQTGRPAPKRVKQQMSTGNRTETCSLPERTREKKEGVAALTTTNNQTESEEQASFQKATTLLPKQDKAQSAIPRYPRNIALQLQQRALRGLISSKPIIKTPPIPWSTASWLKFQCPRSGAPLTGACLMEWDSMGVLLAIMTSHDSSLRIYDWDTVSASDAKGRNHRVRRKTNPDTNYAGGSFRIDGREAARQQSGRATGSAKPVKVELPLRRHISVNLLFLEADTMIVTAGEEMACISTRKSTQRSGGIIVPSVKWSMTWKNNTISSLTRLTSNLVLLGSLDGNLSVVSSTKTQKVSFATVASPVVLHSWFSGNALRHPGSQHMGIYHLGVENEPIQNKCFGDVRATWVTACGWTVAAVIDIKDGKPVNPSTVLHRTAPVQCKNHRNEPIDLGKKGGWSLPAQKLGMTGTGDYLCWERVPDIVQILPDHDKFVVDNRPRRVTIPGQSTLHVMNRHTGQRDKLLLGKGSKQILAIAMHSSHEWVLVSTAEDGIRFYNARKKIS